MPYVSGSVYPVMCRMEVSPGSGVVTTVAPPYDHVLFTNGSTLSAATVALPDPVSAAGLPKPSDGDMVRISTVSAITTLTVTPTPLSVPSTLAAGGGVWMVYSATQLKWFAF